MADNRSLSYYIPSFPHAIIAISFLIIGLTLGKWMTFLFDGSSFATLDGFALGPQNITAINGAASKITSSTVMAMKRALEMMPVSLAASAVSYLFVVSRKRQDKTKVHFSTVISDSWRVACLFFGLLSIFFMVSTLFSIVDVSIGLGRKIPFIGAIFSLLYGLIYPISTLISFLLILFSYFVALGPLHAVGMIEQEKLKASGLVDKSVSLKQILFSIRDLVVESGVYIRPLLLCGWCCGIIPLFIYQIFLIATIHPATMPEEIGIGFLQNIIFCFSTAVVETPFLFISLFISFFFVSKAHDE